MSNAPAGILARLRARANAPAPEPTPATPATPTTVATPFGPATVEPGRELAPAEAANLAARAEAASVAPGQINPPEFQPAPTEAQERAAKAAPVPAASTSDGSRFRRTKAEIEAGLTVEQAKAQRSHKETQRDTAESKAPAAPEGVQPPASEGPSPAAESAPTAESEAPAAEVPVNDVRVKVAGVDCGAPASGERMSIPAPRKLGAKPIPVLFVNCAPMSGTYVLASQLASQANAKICVDQSIADYRYIQYGAGPGALRATVMDMIDGAAQCPPIMVDTSSPEGAALVTDLEARAAQIVRGFR